MIDNQGFERAHLLVEGKTQALPHRGGKRRNFGLRISV
jgi:hypothetical protein